MKANYFYIDLDFYKIYNFSKNDYLYDNIYQLQIINQDE